MIQCARTSTTKQPLDGSIRSACILCQEEVWITHLALIVPLRPVCDACHPALPVTVTPE